MYKKKHNVHDTYIYGYDDDNFFISAYEGGKLRKLTARKKEIVECVYKTKSDKIKEKNNNMVTKGEVDYYI